VISDIAAAGELSPEFRTYITRFEDNCGCPQFPDDILSSCTLCPDNGVQNPYVPAAFALMGILLLMGTFSGFVPSFYKKIVSDTRSNVSFFSLTNAFQAGSTQFICSNIVSFGATGVFSPEVCAFMSTFDVVCGCPQCADSSMQNCSICPTNGIQNPYVVSLL
jgi:hypothetical protein